MRREIWFWKMGWSYVPCHWKGFAVMAAVILPTLAAITLGEMALDALGYPGADGLALPVFLIAGLLVLFPIAKRHS